MDATAEIAGLIGEILALSQNGLHFSRDVHDRERYERLREIAIALGDRSGLMSADSLRALSLQDVGYCTPKVDVRAAIFVSGNVLLVREEFDEGRWTLPGGWADTNETAAEAVVREVWEEARIECTAARLAALLDRSRHPHEPAMASRVYKLIFLCEPVPEATWDSTRANFFPVSDLPPLSIDRILPEQIRRAYEHAIDPTLPADFD